MLSCQHRSDLTGRLPRPVRRERSRYRQLYGRYMTSRSQRFEEFSRASEFPTQILNGLCPIIRGGGGFRFVITPLGSAAIHYWPCHCSKLLALGACPSALG